MSLMLRGEYSAWEDFEVVESHETFCLLASSMWANIKKFYEHSVLQVQTFQQIFLIHKVRVSLPSENNSHLSLLIYHTNHAQHSIRNIFPRHQTVQLLPAVGESIHPFGLCSQCCQHFSSTPRITWYNLLNSRALRRKSHPKTSNGLVKLRGKLTGRRLAESTWFSV